MKTLKIPRYLVVGFCTLLMSAAIQADPLSFAQAPPGTAKDPAPNVIVSVDDSGSMGTTGIATLKSALTQTFSASNVYDGRIRLAWQSMNRCSGIPSPSAACENKNGMKPLAGTHRTNFMNWVNGLTHGGPTPSHLMIDQAGSYLSNVTLGAASPWAANPGVAETPILACRKSFHILMTDGGWNGTSLYADANFRDAVDASDIRIVRGGNADGGADRTLPDGTAYQINSNQNRLYRDVHGSANLSTLSDIAFHYWATDLQPSIANSVRPSIKQTGTFNFGTAANPALLEEYWNPKNNPATWQHMVNYTIGFNDAATWAGSPTWAGNTHAGLAPIIRGTIQWPTPYCGNNNTGTGNLPCDTGTGYTAGTSEPLASARKMDYWHTALNSRGLFVPAPNAQALVDAFQTILTQILDQTATQVVSVSASSTRLRSTESLYIAEYNSEQWSGELAAYGIATNATVNSTPTWRASTRLDTTTFSVDGRLIRTSPGGTITSSFLWGSLTTAMQSDLSGPDGTATGAARLEYLRGVRSGERQNGGQFRNRASRLGDIVNSNIWMTGKPIRMSFEHLNHATFRTAQATRTPTLYVGANDGMLHGFNANNGAELMAYVPRGIYPKLRAYTQESYAHEYSVDGHPFTGDADVSGRLDTTTTTPDWRTILVSGLGAGGKGYFILDVTNPTDPQVMYDNTLPSDNDVGHIFSLPVVDAVNGSRSEQIVKMNNGRWAVVMGNGYNSQNERPVLLIQYLDGDRSLQKIVANVTMAQSNGLSAPRLIDVNGDGKVDLAYSGDLQGNMWKFNLTSATASQWAVAGTGPLFTAQFPLGTRQPITVAPVWMAPPQGGIQIAFGTGRNVTEADRSNTATQTIYSIWDSSAYASSTTTVTVTSNMTAITGRSQLVEQTVLNSVTSTSTASAVTNPYFNTSQNDVNYTGSNPKRGWFLDLPVSRERVLNNPSIYEGQKILVSTSVPKYGNSGETCDMSTVGEDNYINVLNMFSGKPSKSPVFSVADSSMNMANASRTRWGTGDYVTLKKSSGTDLVSPKPGGGGVCPTGQVCTDKLTLRTGTTPGARADWREIR